MTEQTAKGYNIAVTVIGTIDTTPTVKGTKKIKFRGSFNRQGKTVERTVVAQGAAADAIEAVITAGATATLRVIFDSVPGDDGKPAGQFLTVLGLPLPPKAKAA